MPGAFTNDVTSFKGICTVHFACLGTGKHTQLIKRGFVHAGIYFYQSADVFLVVYKFINIIGNKLAGVFQLVCCQ